MRLFFHRRPIGRWAVLLALAFCLSGEASVFKVFGRNWSGWVPTTGLSWTKAYQTQMKVNGKRVELHVYTARYSEPVEQQLKAVLESIGAQVKSVPSGGAGTATLNGYEVKYLISSPPTEPVKFIFLSYSDPASAPVAAEKPDFPVPLYPNGKVLSSVSDKRTKTDSITIRTMDSSTEVHEYYQGLLTSDGWAQTMPSKVDSGESKGLAIYQKRGQICFIDVVRGKNLSSTVCILVEKSK